MNNKGYIVTGIDNGEYQNDLWEYDPSTDTWTKKRNITNVSDEAYDDEYATITGIGKVGFSINGKGYLATGGQTTGSEVWEYNPATDLWVQKTSFEGSTRTDAVGFASETGLCSNRQKRNLIFDDIWGFDPDAVFNDKD